MSAPLHCQLDSRCAGDDHCGRLAGKHPLSGAVLCVLGIAGLHDFGDRVLFSGVPGAHVLGVLSFGSWRVGLRISGVPIIVPTELRLISSWPREDSSRVTLHNLKVSAFGQKQTLNLN